MEATLADLDLAEGMQKRMDYRWQTFCKEFLAVPGAIITKAERILCKTMSPAERIKYREPLQVETILQEALTGASGPKGFIQACWQRARNGLASIGAMRKQILSTEPGHSN